MDLIVIIIEKLVMLELVIKQIFQIHSKMILDRLKPLEAMDKNIEDRKINKEWRDWLLRK